ncbi:RluA family pseudouridine synthase [candidate division WOR-3 bacterium]|nr:RluA family pseudouridine synthase [candidate division WOR-3 bacterium]
MGLLEKEFKRIVSRKMAGERLDRYLITSGIGFSRSITAKLIKQGKITVNSKPAKPAQKLAEGDEVYALLELPDTREESLRPQEIPLDIVYEDDDIILVNKPPHMVVHPARGHSSGTLINALLAHCGDLPRGEKGEVRPGVVHRLDKDTTGLILFAKTYEALRDLTHQTSARSMHKEYVALAWGKFELSDGEIAAPIGRSTLDRRRMTVTPISSRDSRTRFRLEHVYAGCVSCLRLWLVTGRTHQIRVHLAHYGHPVVGDVEYGGREQIVPCSRTEAQVLAGCLERIMRQALHAKMLGFVHPASGKEMRFETELPADMQNVVDFLEEYEKSHNR